MNNKSSFQKKIAGYSLLAGSLIAVHVDGQVIYTDVQPDVEVGGVVPSDFPYFDSYGLDLNNDGITDFNVNLTISAYNNANSSEGFNFVEIIQPAVDGNFIAAENGGYHLDNAATFLPAEIIGPDLPGQPEWGVEGQLGYVYRYYNTYVNERDNFVVGFQFKISGQIHYGWARLAINTIPSSNPELVNIVLKEYAYESMANTPIGAGNTGQGCPMPENVLVDDILKDEAEVSWTGTGNAYSYSIRYREVGSTTWSYSEVLAPTVLQTMTGLTPSTNYEVEVQTYCDEAKTDSSGYTAAIVFTTDAVCTVPQKLEAINLSATKATINWADDFDGVYKYVLQWREIGTETWITAYIFPPATSKQINNLNPGSQYEVKVQSWCNSTGTSASDFSAPVFF
ncbi:MAG TPA: fibronectin type III domain-containing protein, partial [Chitinophagales bacterium]|nr:fibronectin type III domain-containing protein [Chitinophagales bacterium]